MTSGHTGARCAGRKTWGGRIRATEGYTIAESTVAIALLLTVLIPAAATLTYLATQQHTRHTVEALALARRTMERTLASEAYEPSEESVGPWRIVTGVEERGRLVAIAVHVYRGEAERPVIELTTARRIERPEAQDE